MDAAAKIAHCPAVSAKALKKIPNVHENLNKSIED